MIEFNNYGQQRDLDCTEAERAIYGEILAIYELAGLDLSPLQLVRKSDKYVSAVMDSGSDFGAMDVARFKFTDRAKWICIGPGFEKTKINSPDDVADMAEELVASYRFNEPYL